MTDLFDVVNSSPEEEKLATPQPENGAKASGEQEQAPAGIPAEKNSEELIDEDGEHAGPDEAVDEADSEETPEALVNKQEVGKQVNVVEEDPYEFNQCLITVAMALMPDDGSPDGRKVMLGVRNHQDEPILKACRLGELLPLPDPVQQLLDQLKEQLPARSEKTTERKKAAEDRKKAASASKTKAAPAPKQKKAEGSRTTSMNLFEMFDQPPRQEVKHD